MRVGYVGLGAMGGALASHLVRKHALGVLDLNPAVVASFVERGARAAENGADLARRSEVVLLCLPRSADVRNALFGPNGLAEGLLPGSVVIDQTSGLPSETREFARLLQARGVTLLDAPVSGAMATAVAGTVSIIASGERAAFERVRPLLTDMSPNLFYVGETVGNGQTMKAVNNMMNASCRLATLELVALGRKSGLSLETMIEALNATTARNFTTQGMLPAIAQGRQSTKFGLALQVKDVNQAVAMGGERGVTMPLCSLAAGMLQIGLNTLGPGSQLEQMIGVVEGMAATRFAAPQA
ncbi:MAG: NAD(P)-dependent oxidoreductase [Piscinibacter sp.]|uniref:NAD(P)-dependent oxidoreductase n=1 Tax=Piscinibacter TaxID=1114981 RepID=UPI000FDE69F7|nr:MULTISPECIES: NAD(P)-dependent oxidoreductase [Piscinibacter]MCW5666257.1 NAD(P)-dependent oxidoreductase [Piscinibacter sp.]